MINHYHSFLELVDTNPHQLSRHKSPSAFTFSYWQIDVFQAKIISSLFQLHPPFPKACRLTHLSWMNFPTFISRTSSFPILGGWVVFFIFIQNLIEHSVSKQWRPWSDATFFLCPNARPLWVKINHHSHSSVIYYGALLCHKYPILYFPLIFALWLQKYNSGQQSR